VDKSFKLCEFFGGPLDGGKYFMSPYKIEQVVVSSEDSRTVHLYRRDGDKHEFHFVETSSYEK
jgi:hypothetical protein